VLGVVDHGADGGGKCPRIVTGDEGAAFGEPEYFGECACFGGDHGGATGHRFYSGKTEAFIA